MKKNYCLIIVLTVLLCVLPLSATVTFSSLDLNFRNTLLFAASAKNPWHPDYQMLFSVNTEGRNLQVLSCFPETMELLEDGSTLQIRNWFGTARFTAENATLQWTSQSPLFEKGTPLPYNPPAQLSVSPDGNWTAYLRKTGAAGADLVLIDERTSIQTVVVSNTEFSTKSVPIKWSTDSSFLVYEKEGKLLFAEPSSFFEKKRIGEQYRTIGSGTISAVCWVGSEQLVYVNGRDIYSIPKNELYTRSLYASLTVVGKRVGQLPASFDCKRDVFWMNNTGTAVLYVQNRTNLWMYELSSSSSGKNAFVAPFVSLPPQVTSVQIFWTDQNLPVIWVEQLSRNERTALAFSMIRSEQKGGGVQYYIKSLEFPVDAKNPAISPDRTKMSFISSNSLKIYDTATWQNLHTFDGESVYTYLWANNEALFVGGYETIRSWNFKTKVQHVVFLSSAKNFAWSANGQSVLAEAAGRVLVFNSADGIWTTTEETLQRSPSVQNENVRVYLDSSRKGYFANAIYVRLTGDSVSTKPLFSEPDATDVGAYARHKPKVSLVFEACENADGLTEILDVLKKNSLKSTFFINGEFLRRYPSGVQEIVSAGHQCGSLFFSNMDLLSGAYSIDENFVMQGLARNEDDFFNVTGSDMSLIWHTPQYLANSMIISAGEKAGYVFVKQDIAPADWVTLDESARMPGMYKTSRELVEWINAKVKNGSVISIQTGIQNGRRPDYLYEYLDVLVNTLLTRGYEIVPYSEL